MDKVQVKSRNEEMVSEALFYLERMTARELAIILKVVKNLYRSGQ